MPLQRALVADAPLVAQLLQRGLPLYVEQALGLHGIHPALFRLVALVFQTRHHPLNKGIKSRLFQADDLHIGKANRADYFVLRSLLRHPQLIAKLLNSGLYAGYIPKQDANYIVFTVQGFVDEINPLIKRVTNYLRETGGGRRVTVKEERVIAYKVCGIESSDLPEVADKVEYYT